MLCADGQPGAEVSRRIGEAWRAYLQLERVWRHANITRDRKIDLYVGCIIPKVMYGLESLWLRQAERKRLDAFHAKCLRRVLGIPHSYISRITNQEVLSRADANPLSTTLLQRQLLLFGKIARMPDHCPQRQVLFEPSSVTLKRIVGKRPRGRPRQQWGQSVRDHALAAAGSMSDISLMLLQNSTTEHWKGVVQDYAFRNGDQDAHENALSE